MKAIRPTQSLFFSLLLCLFSSLPTFSQCELSNLTITTGPCINGDLFEITVDVDTMDLTNGFFDWEIPGVQGGFASFDDLPFTLSITNTTIPVMEFVICVNDNPNCCADQEFVNPCYSNCEIDDVTSTASDCTNGLFDVTIDFEFANVSDSFNIVGNGNNYGIYSYANVPITLFDLSADCTTPYEFVVVDADNPNCSDFVEHGIECCAPCVLSNLTITPGPCTNGNLFDIVVDFDTSGVTNAFFDWEIPGEGSGFESFDNLPLVLSIENDDNDSLSIFICVNDNPNCCIDGAFANPCFGSVNCELWDMSTSILACEMGDFDIQIDFLYANVSDSFNLVGNGVNYGNFAYVDLPISLLTLDADCTTPYEFVAIDLNDPTCSVDINHGLVCCGSNSCELSNLTLTTSDCINNEFFELTIEFDTSFVGNNFFDWEIPGEGSGFESFDDLPLTLTIDNTTSDSLEIYICVNDNPNCCISGAFANPCYNMNACNIYDMEVTDTVCNNNLFDVTLNFLYQNVSDSFSLAGNGMNYGNFAYADLPLTLEDLEANCSTDYEFVATDLLDSSCSDFTELGEVCCMGNCEIYDLTISVSDCDNNETFTITFDFEYENPGNDFFDWEIPGEGGGSALLSDLPLSITINNDSNEVLLLELCINDNPNCCTQESFENPCFTPSNCELWDMVAEVHDCVDSLFNVTIDFFHENASDSFDLVGNGMNHGTFAYDNLPVTLNGLFADCSTGYEFVALDNEFPNCSTAVGVGQVCCSDSCEINNLIIEVGDCINGESFEVTIDFDFAGNTNDFFDWEIPGVGSGFELFDDLPLTIVVFNTSIEVMEIVICENDNPSCCTSGEFINPCYVASPCIIDDLTATVLSCDNDSFSIEIDFFFDNTSDSFYLAGNGINYGYFAYADLPITLTGLAADCNTFYEFVAIDADDPNCSDFIEHGEVCCTNLNRVTNVDLTQMPVTNNEIFIDFNLAHTTLPGCQLEVYVNGDLMVELGYLETEFELGPFLCEDDTDYLVEIKNSCRPDEVQETFMFNFADVSCTSGVNDVWSDMEVNYDTNSKIIEILNGSKRDITITLMDFNGGVWMQDQTNQLQWMHRFSDMPSGIYLVKLKVMTDQGPSFLVKKIFIP